MGEPRISRRLNIAVQYACEAQDLPERALVRRALRAAYDNGGTVTIRFVGTEEGQELNRQYRNKNYPTNVLSFAYDNEIELIGDLIICWPVVQQEAINQNKAVLDHCAHLLVHGMLHLQGYDHETDAQAEVMENLERQILAKLGIADPYLE